MFASIAARLSFSPPRLHPAANLERGAPNQSRLIAGAFVFLPGKNQIPQAAWIDAQGIADVAEGERSISLVMENPELGFSVFLPPARTFRIEIALNTSHCIGEDTAHQAHDRFD